VAGGAAVEVGVHARNEPVGVGTSRGELDVDVAVELVEASFACQLGRAGAEQRRDQIVVPAHATPPSLSPI